MLGPGRMVRREIERLEVVELVLDLPVPGFLETPAWKIV